MLHNVLIGRYPLFCKGHDGLHGLDGIPGEKGDQVKANGPVFWPYKSSLYRLLINVLLLVNFVGPILISWCALLLCC